MLNEVKGLFKNKKGVLIILSMITLAICAYLNLITVKSVTLFNVDWLRISLGTLMVSFIPMITSEIMCEIYGWKKGFIISSVAYTICLIFTIILDLTTRVGFSGAAYDIVNFIDGSFIVDGYA